ncbi:CsbD family protein [Pseudonocardia spinosispora]|uniref:CsbD family protein n=1 Tax=Pseudonocardia spinosispora TaxID=103441 RepID=UPI0003F988FF|nr:CsbD family protein [Pseudonocardia spinosispora]
MGVEGLKGKVKEALGDLTGSDGLREEGQSQQHKEAEQERAENAQQVADEHAAKAEAQAATERERAERAQQVADKHAAKAEHHENEESRNQGT